MIFCGAFPYICGALFVFEPVYRRKYRSVILAILIGS